MTASSPMESSLSLLEVRSVTLASPVQGGESVCRGFNVLNYLEIKRNMVYKSTSPDKKITPAQFPNTMRHQPNDPIFNTCPHAAGPGSRGSAACSGHGRP